MKGLAGFLLPIAILERPLLTEMARKGVHGKERDFDKARAERKEWIKCRLML